MTGGRLARSPGYQARSEVQPNDAATRGDQHLHPAERIEDTGEDEGRAADEVGQQREPADPREALDGSGG